jgi:hypothetical protein
MEKDVLLKTLNDQLAAAKGAAVSLEKAAAAVKAAPDFAACTAADAAGAFGSDTGRIAAAAAPVIDTYHDALFLREPLRGDDLRTSDACVATAQELKNVAERALADANTMLGYARGVLGITTRTAVDIITTQHGSRTADPDTQARFRVDAGRPLAIIDERRGGVRARKNRGAGLRAEVSSAQAAVEELQAENDALRSGIEAPRPVAAIARPPAAPARRGRPRR